MKTAIRIGENRMKKIVSMLLSVVRPSEYSSLRKSGAGRAFLAILAMTIVFGTVAYAGFAVQIGIGTVKLKEQYETKVPYFRYSAENGVEVDSTMPLIFRENDWIFIVDCSDPTDGILAEKYAPMLKEYRKGAVIGNRTVINKKNLMNTETYDLNQLNSFAPFDKGSVAKLFSYWWVIALACFPFYLLWFYAAKLLSALLLSLIALVINASGKYRLNYAEMLNACVYALTLPVIIDIVLGFTDVKIPFFFLIYHVIAAVFIAVGLKKTSEAGRP